MSLIAVYCLGYYLHKLKDKVETLEEVIKSKVDKQPEPEEPISTLIDPLDPIQTAIYERDKMFKKMNNLK